ncbi:MAG TPA: hypothetical protein VM537_03485 [Anaerolineae bacterium]|nr:hypothetical protein [Anaerolineae bacterium]
MATPTKYTYSIADDLPDAAVHASNLEEEIQAQLSGIITQVDHIDTNDDVLDIWFKDALSAEEKTALDGDAAGPAGGLLAAHSSVPAEPLQAVTLDVSSGPQLVHSSPRPIGLNTFFSSAGDGVQDGEDLKVAEGALLIFNMAVDDAEKSVELIYNETVYIKDGYVICAGAPLGAWVSAEVYDPTGTTKLGGFVSKSLLLGDARVSFNTDDYGVLPQTFKLRLTIHNADGTGEEDAAAAFKAIARVEMYRAATA